MKKSLLIIFISFLSLQSFSQSPEDAAVKKTIETFFTAMKNADSTGIISCFADSAILQTVRDKDGKVNIETEAVASFASVVVNLAKGDADERIGYDVIKTDGNLASVWTPYNFYYKGRFSHCGANSFQLVKLNGDWKIQYIIDTRRKTNCTN
jgi:hypothetical protein